MKKRQKTKIYPVLTTLVIIICLLGILSYVLPKFPNAQPQPTEKNLDSFTQCLTEKNVKMYGSIKNTNSVSQMQMFEGSLGNLNYIDCSERKEDCKEVLILPSWEIDGKLIHGAVSLEVLSKLTGCELWLSK